MAQKIRGRGRTGEGSEVKIQSAKGELNIYVRKVGSEKNNLAPIVLVHGVLANSWSYKELLDEFQKNDREAYGEQKRCIARLCTDRRRRNFSRNIPRQPSLPETTLSTPVSMPPQVSDVPLLPT